MAETKLYSLEQMELLMLVAGSDDPVGTALQIRNRWATISVVAKLAQKGIQPEYGWADAVKWDLTNHPDAYVIKATQNIIVLDEWLAEQKRRRG